jgi:hypothetical protein
VATLRDELSGRRCLRTWQRAVEHLNSHGYGAAVPAEFVDPLRQRGLTIWPAGTWAAAGAALDDLGWDGVSDPFEPVTGEEPEVQRLIWDPEGAA